MDLRIMDRLPGLVDNPGTLGVVPLCELAELLSLQLQEAEAISFRRSARSSVMVGRRPQMLQGLGSKVNLTCLLKHSSVSALPRGRDATDKESSSIVTPVRAAE